MYHSFFHITQQQSRDTFLPFCFGNQIICCYKFIQVVFRKSLFTCHSKEIGNWWGSNLVHCGGISTCYPPGSLSSASGSVRGDFRQLIWFVKQINIVMIILFEVYCYQFWQWHCLSRIVAGIGQHLIQYMQLVLQCVVLMFHNCVKIFIMVSCDSWVLLYFKLILEVHILYIIICVSVSTNFLFLELKLVTLSVKMCCCGVYCR